MTDDPSLEALLARVAAGDRDAFARLYRASSPQLFGIALRMLRRRDLAAEAVQDAYLRIWQSAGGFAPERSGALTWMASILRHRAIDLLRRGHETLIEDDPAAQRRLDALAVEPAVDGADGRALQRCLDALEPKQRDCIRLAYCDGFTHEELSRRLETPVGTVKSWIRRGLLRLKECLGP